VTALPPPREPGRYRIAVVCLGNICRSPVAEVILSSRIAGVGLADQVEVTSSGTGTWHLGEAMDARAASTLTAAGYDGSRHAAQKFDPGSLAGLDLVLAMDGSNLADIRATLADLTDADADRVRLFRDFDPDEPGGDVPDPFYGGDAGFEEVLTMVERTAAVIVAALRDECASGSPTTGTTTP
jgi:protein-tyrosine phosphatase